MADKTEEQERRRKSERDISEHDRLMERNAAHASRDTLHDANAGQESGAYTTEQARDRAAHTPSILERLDAPRTRHEEDRMIHALHQELFPTERAKEAYDHEHGPEVPPASGPDRQQWHDLREMRGSATTQADAKENSTMTPEQQASIDKALGRADLNQAIGAASNVSGKPTPNDPTPMEKVNDIGKDLHDRGVTMEK